MSRRRLLHEWPLIFFTLAVQAGCGLAIGVTITEMLEPLPARSLRAFGVAILPVVAVGVLVSLLHLGRPMSGWRVLNNFRNSKLSREALMLMGFSICAIASSVSWWVDGNETHRFADTITSLLGICSVIASAEIYRLRSRPRWNSNWVLTSFIGSTVAVSGLVLLNVMPTRTSGIWIGIAGLIILLISSVWMAMHTFLDLQKTGYVRVVAAVIFLPLPGVLLLLLLPTPATSWWLIGAILVPAFTLIGTRILMFALAELELPF